MPKKKQTREPLCSLEKMQQKDLKVLYKLGVGQWPAEKWLTLDYLKSAFKQKGLHYVAKIDGKVVGGVIFVFEDIVKNWIRYIIVDKNARRLGIGARLINSLASSLKPGESIFVDTGVRDKTAIQFYEKNGFKKRGKIQSFYDKEPAYILEKNIK